MYVANPLDRFVFFISATGGIYRVFKARCLVSVLFSTKFRSFHNFVTFFSSTVELGYDVMKWTECSVSL